MAGTVDIFELLMRNFSNGAYAKYVQKYGKLKTNVDRMNFVYKDIEKYKVHLSFKEDIKSDSVAGGYRQDGNQYYKQGKYRDALNYYTMSVLNAKTKDELSLGYANRSAALLKLQLYQECLQDIERAFENGYPEKLKYKLVARQENAQLQKIVTTHYYEPLPSIADSEKNRHIQYARNCVKVLKNEKFGRYVVATRRIEIGEILAVEPPYSAILKNEIYIHCHECLELCYNMIPCDQCTKALYCTNECKDKAYSKYHKYECPILLSLDYVTLDFAKRLALKIYFMSKKEWNSDNVDESTDSIYRSDRFKEIYNLESHIEKRPIEKLLARTAIACGLFDLVKNHTTFLEDCINEDKFKEMLFLIICICGVNTVNINELIPSSSGLIDLDPIATAVYPFFTLFNHSCWPNISRHYHGSSIILRAQNTIEKGEQCFVVYGPNYVQYNKEFRQIFLSNHQFFTCTCRACEENWSKATISVDPQWTMFNFFSTMKLRGADVDAAKQELPELLMQAKKAERSLPPGSDYMIKDLLSYCYDIFGNKRRF